MGEVSRVLFYFVKTMVIVGLLRMVVVGSVSLESNDAILKGGYLKLEIFFVYVASYLTAMLEWANLVVTLEGPGTMVLDPY
jgi:hypothetical protein